MLKENKYYPNVLDIFIKELKLKNFLIIALTSKTYSEVVNLYKLNNIKFPFSAENGATFFVPKSNNKQDLVFKQIINKNATTSEKIIRKIECLPFNIKKNIVFIKDLSVDKQMKITRLKRQELKYFNRRNFSVSIIWKASNYSLFSLKKYLKKLKLQATFGGKMINISGIHNKLDALIYFKQLYFKNLNIKKCITVSIGDSENDVEILNYSDYSGIVIRKDKGKIKLVKNHNVFISSKPAPMGWVELLSKINKIMEREDI